MLNYIAILLIFLIVAIFLEIKYKIYIYHSLKEKIIFIGTFFIIGIIWDYYATYNKHWVFPGPGLIGIKIFNLPLEEFLFFIIMPYFILTMYKYYDLKIK